MFISLPIINFSDFEKEQNEGEIQQQVEDYLMDESGTLDMDLVEELRKKKYESLYWLKNNYIAIPRDYHHYKHREKALMLFDKVSGQKDAIFSGLYWHQSMEEAQAEARISGKPILSLRMLGDFSEDLSCANSRFFRILLYSDTNISRILQNDFILHVTSVIDVPKITIEYPDGTVQQQTITGNSMHMIMDADGNILDALPGLYGPNFFKNWLSEFMYGKNIKSTDRLKYIIQNRKRKITRLEKLLAQDEDFIFVDNNLSRIIEGLSPPVDLSALQAEVMAIGKSVVEVPVLKKILPEEGGKVSPQSPSNFNPEDKRWIDKLNSFGFVLDNLDDNTIKLISVKKEYPTQEELDKTIRQLSAMVSMESIRNELNLHLRILKMLNNGEKEYSEDEFVDEVYAQLFKTPLDDYKMGMYRSNLFYGLTDDGF